MHSYRKQIYIIITEVEEKICHVSIRSTKRYCFMFWVQECTVHLKCASTICGEELTHFHYLYQWLFLSLDKSQGTGSLLMQQRKAAIKKIKRGI